MDYISMDCTFFIQHDLFILDSDHLILHQVFGGG
jgi:hypothetical protein